MNHINIQRKPDVQTSKSIPDYVVVEKVLQGETELFEILMRRYNELLFRTIRSYIDVDVEDTMQDAYIKAYQKLYQFKNEAKFSTWLVRIGINEALQRKRKSTRYRTLDITQESSIIQIPDTAAMDPENRTIQKESLVYIEKAIDALPSKYKIIYILKEVEGMDISEIAKSLELTKSNVKVRLHRARKMMKEFLLKSTNTQSIFEFGNHKCDRLVDKVMNEIAHLKCSK